MPGETPRKGIFYSRLGDDDRFTPRLRLDAGAGDPAHPRITSDEHTDIAVVWDERASDGRRVVLRRIVEGVAAPPEIFAGDGANYPAVAGPSGSWVVVWSAQGPDGLTRIEGRRLPTASTP